MKIWKVSIGNELDCGWSNKQDAINYLKEEAESNGWHLSSPLGGKDENKDTEDYLSYWCTDAEDYTWIVYIEPMFFNEKPYW